MGNLLRRARKISELGRESAGLSDAKVLCLSFLAIESISVVNMLNNAT